MPLLMRLFGRMAKLEVRGEKRIQSKSYITEGIISVILFEQLPSFENEAGHC